jgi:hypothetical protein
MEHEQTTDIIVTLQERRDGWYVVVLGLPDVEDEGCGPAPSKEAAQAYQHECAELLARFYDVPIRVGNPHRGQG